MKKQFIVTASLCLFFWGISSRAQISKEVNPPTQKPVASYNYQQAFAPNFYTKDGSETRSTSGQPAAKY